MKTTQKITHFALILCAIITGANAEPRIQGAYADLLIGLAVDPYRYFNPVWDLFEPNHNSFLGVNINPNIGYQFNKYFALEVGYQYFFENTHIVDVAAKFIQPFTVKNHDFSFYARLGPSFLMAPHHSTYGEDESVYTPFAVAGLGLSHTLNKNLDLSVELQVLMPSLRAGLRYHF
jgi:hypothetical protein